MKYPILFLSAIVALASCGNPTKDGSNEKETQDTVPTTPQLPSKVSMAFMGDVMMGTNFPEGSHFVTPDRGKTLFVDCQQHIKGADVAIANLEGTCYDGTEGTLRKKTNSRFYFIFRMPGDHAQVLADAGVDMVNCANNHSNDFGMIGRQNTLKTIRGVGIECSGIRDLAEGCVVERNGVKFGYVSFAASCTNVLDMLDYEEIEKMVKKYRGMCDVLSVGFHGGAEGTNAIHVPKKEEWYLGEDRGDVMKFAHFCIDNGADIVVGHGPHVPRAMELYKGHLIAYSLGNFCGPYRLGFGGQCGHAPLLMVNLNPNDGTFLDGQIYSYRQVRGKGPRTDEKNSAANDIRTLTQQDFPDTPLSVSETGAITKK